MSATYNIWGTNAAAPPKVDWGQYDTDQHFDSQTTYQMQFQPERYHVSKQMDDPVMQTQVNAKFFKPYFGFRNRTIVDLFDIRGIRDEPILDKEKYEADMAAVKAQVDAQAKTKKFESIKHGSLVNAK